MATPTIPGSKSILAGPDAVWNLTSGAPSSPKFVKGTVQMDAGMGVVESASFSHKGNKMDITGCDGNVMAKWFTQTGWTGELELLFSTDVSVPRIGQMVIYTLPVTNNLDTTAATIQCQCMVTDRKFNWEKEGTRKWTLSVEAEDTLQSGWNTRVLNPDGTLATNGDIQTGD